MDGPEPQPEPELGDPKTKRILVVDDDESILEMLKMMVLKEGFLVETAVDGKEAIQRVAAQSPDLVLLDFMLPVMGGFEVLKALQKEDARVPIVVVTGRNLDRPMVEMVRQEANVIDFMTKPIKPAVLAGLLHRVLKTRPPEVDRRTHINPWG